jgi:hypothetical protein
LEEVIRLNPADDPAGAELKLKKTPDGKYVTERETKEKQGLVKYLGEWMKPEDRDKFEKGAVKLGGAWKKKKDLDGKLQAEKDRQRAVRDAAEFEELKAKWSDRVKAHDKDIRERLGQGFRADYVNGFILHTNVPERDCAMFRQVMSDFKRQWVGDFGRDLGIIHETPMNVYFFATRDEYIDGVGKMPLQSSTAACVAAAKNLPGFSFCPLDPGAAGIFMYRYCEPGQEWSGLDTYVHVFLHECIHVLLNSKYPGAVSLRVGPGVNDGFATFIEGVAYDKKTRSFEWGRRNLLHLSYGRSGRKKMDYRSLVNMSPQEFQTKAGAERYEAYGLAENFTNYLMNCGDRKYRKQYLKFIASYGDSGESESDRVKRLEKYVGIQLEQMEKECDEYTAQRNDPEPKSVKKK